MFQKSRFCESIIRIADNANAMSVGVLVFSELHCCSSGLVTYRVLSGRRVRPGFLQKLHELLLGNQTEGFLSFSNLQVTGGAPMTVLRYASDINIFVGN